MAILSYFGTLVTLKLLLQSFEYKTPVPNALPPFSIIKNEPARNAILARGSRAGAPAAASMMVATMMGSEMNHSEDVEGDLYYKRNPIRKLLLRAGRG